ncbi:d-alanyl-d-alanine carboxypeptidase [Leptolyngbya sp. Heron Island J]|uniref:M15 family metallopeptidase n=1 Tax=Leptolyngbya sp. Heron Island J TaxID=1385935 RepID=UPI0003B99E6B|nr:M15 family metallopeptidase [Leptolyngbya sp. Heron Island J]ESA32398.1 d-alanyl-d-alanine carboxypeptidase [Leptolyngbya sp. Heron Island J]
MANFTDDIPEARRETLISSPEPSLAKPASNSTAWILLVIAILGLAGAGIWWFKPWTSVVDIPEPVEPAATGSAVAAEQAIAASETAAPPAPDSASTDSASENSESNDPVSLLGHRQYALADTNSLVAISTNAMVRLKPEAAQKVEAMIADAKAAGAHLDVISGFRSLEDQQYLFFDLKAERGQTTQTRAEVSAPPGYSEHHTGYAIDFIDGTQPATDLEVSFEGTPAFRWLEENAAYYGFELSFPKGNDQNVAYEPWHWRYVGNQESLELFYQD